MKNDFSTQHTWNHQLRTRNLVLYPLKIPFSFPVCYHLVQKLLAPAEKSGCNAPGPLPQMPLEQKGSEQTAQWPLASYLEHEEDFGQHKHLQQSRAGVPIVG